MGMALLFQLCHRMHITVIVLNFTRERVPSEERERGLKCIFKIFQGYIIQLICVHMCNHHRTIYVYIWIKQSVEIFLFLYYALLHYFSSVAGESLFSSNTLVHV